MSRKSSATSPPVIYSVYPGAQAGVSNCNLVSPDPLADSITIIPFKMPIQGFQFAIPAQDQEIEFQALARRAEYKIWFNQYIDPAVHIRKFISSGGKPVDPTAAITAFGTPTYHFRRNKKLGKLFQTNEGSGGSVAKVGTVSDYGTGGPF